MSEKHKWELEKIIKAELEKVYIQGYEDGVKAFAWWKDGVQYVGTTGKTLAEALKGKV